MGTVSSQTKNKKQKQALGRGLGSLLGVENHISPESHTSLKEPSKMETFQTMDDDGTRIWQVPVDKIVGNRNQPRKVFEGEALASLSSSIKEKGILQPIVVRRLSQDKFEIIAGERRWRAAQAAGLHEVPVILKGADDQSTLELALIENIQREDLNVIEEAEAYRFLMDEYKLTQQELAKRVGKDRVSIANMVRLLNLSSFVQKMVSESQLSKGMAKLLVPIINEKWQLKVAQKIVDENMSVRRAEKLIAKLNSKDFDNLHHLNDWSDLEGTENAKDKGEGGALQTADQTNHFNTSQKLIKGLSEELQRLLGTKVTIDYKKGRGQLSIHYYSDDELNQVVDQLREVCKA